MDEKSVQIGLSLNIVFIFAEDRLRLGNLSKLIALALHYFCIR